jgi:4-amino-4-deoxy-L-arabinose transferase-like glycosyltransferase
MEFIKGFVAIMIVLTLVSYLMPKEGYQKYVQFFIGILLAVVIIRPVLGWISRENWYNTLEQVNLLYEQLGNIEYQGEHEDVYAIFWGEENP